MSCRSLRVCHARQKMLRTNAACLGEVHLDLRKDRTGAGSITQACRSFPRSLALACDPSCKPKACWDASARRARSRAGLMRQRSKCLCWWSWKVAGPTQLHPTLPSSSTIAERGPLTSFQVLACRCCLKNWACSSPSRGLEKARLDNPEAQHSLAHLRAAAVARSKHGSPCRTSDAVRECRPFKR